MTAEAWEIVRLVVVAGVMGGLFFYIQRKQTTNGHTTRQMAVSSQAQLQDVVNTLAEQLGETSRRLHLVELDNQALKAENVTLKTRIDELEGKNKILTVLLPVVPLAVVVGADTSLFERDRAALRRAGIAFRRVMNATQKLIRAEVRRRRQNGDVPPWWVISAHAGPEGVLLTDGIAPPSFWHEVLEGVSLVVLAACEGSNIADELAGLVDTVIWFQEEVGIVEAADFNYALFRRLVTGKAVDTAFAEAVREVPAVAEYVDIRHS